MFDIEEDMKRRKAGQELADKNRKYKKIFDKNTRNITEEEYRIKYLLDIS